MQWDEHQASRPPAAGAVVLGLIPFVAICFSVSFWDRADKMVGGLPFNLFWLVSWILLSTLCMWGAYRIEVARSKKSDAP